jgi:hypothetical protein
LLSSEVICGVVLGYCQLSSCCRNLGMKIRCQESRSYGIMLDTNVQTPHLLNSFNRASSVLCHLLGSYEPYDLRQNELKAEVWMDVHDVIDYLQEFWKLPRNKLYSTARSPDRPIRQPADVFSLMPSYYSPSRYLCTLSALIPHSLLVITNTLPIGVFIDQQSEGDWMLLLQQLI